MNKFLYNFKRISKFLALPLLSGILVGTSFIPFPGWALLFCYIPLWFKVLSILSSDASLKKVFFASWFTQFVLTIIGFNWIYYVTVEFGRLPSIIGLGALLAFAAFMHLYIPTAITFAAFLIKKFQIKSQLASLCVLAISMGLIERVWPSIFEWNLAYTTLWINWPIFQWADTVGFLGISAWLLIAQAFIAHAIINFKTEKANSLKIIGSVAGIFALLTLSGYLKGKSWEKADQKILIGVAQGNVGNAEKIQSEQKSKFHSYIRGIYTDLTNELMTSNPADLVIWPETAMPFAFDESYHYSPEQKALLKSVSQWQIPVVTGAYSLNTAEKDIMGDSVIRNTVFYISPIQTSPNQNFSAPPYYKTNLLAFGEYMPFGEMFPVLYKLLPFVGVYAKGSGPVIAEINTKGKTLKLGPQICYDSLYPGFSRDLSKNGAQVIFNVTNDSWFGWWAEPFQHQYMTLARAIEVRRPLVRSTNTGVTSAILADGSILKESPINKKWFWTYEIKYRKNPDQTIYTKFGHLDWLLWIVCLILIIKFFRSARIEEDSSSEFEIVDPEQLKAEFAGKSTTHTPHQG